MTEKNYRKTAKNIRDVVEEVGKHTMKDGAEELHEKAKKDYAGDQEVVDVGVSCDGTWQKRGFSSINGVAISMDNGKILDVEALNKHWVSLLHEGFLSCYKLTQRLTKSGRVRIHVP